MALVALLFGFGYTVWSEWYNVNVAGHWGYGEAMPIIPRLGIGIFPLVQWIVVPGSAFWWARQTRSHGA